MLIVAPNAEGRDALFTSAALETLTTLALTADVRTSPLGDPPLTDYSFVVVTDVGVLDGAQAAALQDYVEDGGRALLAAGRAPAASRRCRSRARRCARTRRWARRRASSIGEVDATSSRAARSRRAAGRELLALRQRRTRYGAIAC